MPLVRQFLVWMLKVFRQSSLGLGCFLCFRWRLCFWYNDLRCCRYDYRSWCFFSTVVFFLFRRSSCFLVAFLVTAEGFSGVLDLSSVAAHFLGQWSVSAVQLDSFYSLVAGFAAEPQFTRKLLIWRTTKHVCYSYKSIRNTTDFKYFLMNELLRSFKPLMALLAISEFRGCEGFAWRYFNTLHLSLIVSKIWKYHRLTKF